jgi:long-chain fatty acid transport protein
MKKVLMVIIVCMLSVSMVMAAGFGIGEFGTRSATMGNAVVAQAYDPSVLFYNPAGLGFLTGTNFYGSLTLIDPSAKFVGASPIFDNTVYSAREQLFPPLGIYATHQFSENISAGISLVTPFALGLAWEEEFPGRFVSKDADLKSFYITPTVAYQINPNVSVAAGLDIVFSSITLIRNFLAFGSEGSPGTDAGEVEIKGSSGANFGFTAGVMYKSERLGLGLAYRHSIKNKLEGGDAKFMIHDDLPGNSGMTVAAGITNFGEYGLDQSINSEISFPSYFVAGIYYKITEKLGAEFDYAWYKWDVVDKVELNFDNPDLASVLNLNYSNSYQLRFGVHYELTEKFSLRGGYIYDQTPQPVESVSPLLPDDTRSDYTAGIGYKAGKFQIDIGYMFVDIGERSTVENGEGKNDNNFNGTYNSSADLFMIGVGYSIK